MFHTVLKTKMRIGWNFVAAIALPLLLVLCAGYSPVQAATKGVRQKTYHSPEEAVKALVDAMRSDNIKQMSIILGPQSKSIISSGDKIADKQILEDFIKQYDEKNRIEMVSDFSAVLSVGEKDWPMPIPIVKKGQRWLFDTKAGKDEILNRRIGRNELAVIKVCEAYVDAQQEFALMDTDGDGLFEYAQTFRSSPGKKDGLYWETKEGQESSPLGPFVADARKEGYLKEPAQNRPRPYHGYYYKILKGQGVNAPGGAYDYVVNGSMIGGFALVAYPAKYGSTGIMTFIVNQNGIVYQKNFGKNTTRIAEGLKLFDPDNTWTKVKAE
ncbi:MAG: hypothetical protein A4E65_01204 [Syntrophorhabdus sp. PtaU1.Bin153]|nr:MAG: hypothetical protein A4E65_01204 [Syntrophorhabdus sp. PtaU1.Bin153]